MEAFFHIFKVSYILNLELMHCFVDLIDMFSSKIGTLLVLAG